MSYDLTILENGCAELGIELAQQQKDQYIQYLEQKVARLERRADRDSWRERFRAPFMVKDMKQGRLNPLPWSEKNVEK